MSYQAGREGDRITELWAWVVINPSDDCEGVISQLVHGMNMPMVGADEDRIRSLQPIAEAVAREYGLDVKLARFTNRVEIETLKGGP